MTKHSDAFNELSFETRAICSKVLLQDQIQGMRLEKERLKRRYSQSLKEINEKIKYCERELEN
jgi:hypothetical protein